jgi:hypothetical protein
LGFETTYNCDLCGHLGGAQGTYAAAVAASKAAGWLVLNLEGRRRSVCPWCVKGQGGEVEARRALKAMLSTET